MKALSLTIMIGVAVLSGQASIALAQKKSNQPAKAKVVKELRLLDKAWSLRNHGLSKKLAFTEKVLKNLNEKNYSASNQSKAILATALIALREQETALVGSELISMAAQRAPLSLSLPAARHIWNETLKAIPEGSQLGMNSLSEVALALSTAKHSHIDESHSYFLALKKLNDRATDEALRHLASITPASHYFRQAKLQEGMIFASRGKRESAKTALEIAASLDETEAESAANTKADLLIAIKERAILNLARLHFESGEFKLALSLYRSIDAQSALFYESLSEQGWAFFMAGYPNRALGTEYGATSPHFNQLFQPDQYFLNAAVNYWLCDFQAAKSAIQNFVAHTKHDANLLRKWSKRRDRDDSAQLQKIYKIVEDISQGVTQKNSQLGPKSIQTLGRKQVLMTGVKEINELRNLRLSLMGRQWPKRSKSHFIDALMSLENREKSRLAKLADLSITTMQKDYERSLTQMRLINLEIMTAEKDQLMDKGRTAVGQEFLGTEQEFLEAAEKSPRKWTNAKQEYWKDELDSFVFKKKSQCATIGKERQNEEE